LIALATPISSLTHSLAVIAGLGVLLLLLLRRRDTPIIGWAFFGAVGLSVLWAATIVYTGLIDTAFTDYTGLTDWISIGETIRSAAWIGLIVSMLSRSWNLEQRNSFALSVAIVLGFVFTALLLIDLAPWLGWTTQSALQLPGINHWFLLGRLFTAIGGLVLVHNLFLNATPQSRWGLRMLCIALAGLFGYDLHFYSVAMLEGVPSPDLFAGRGLLLFVVFLLLAWASYRNRRWRFELQVSRQVVFHSLSMISIGLYLVFMSIAAYGAKAIGGAYAGVLQVSVLATALVLVFFSGRFRSWIKVKIAKHFFASKYDYRDEWLRFIATLSGAGENKGASLEERAIQAICDIVDSPGGTLWLPDDQDDFKPSARWNFRTALLGVEPRTGEFVRFLAKRRRIINFAEMHAGLGDYDGIGVPSWAAEESKAWLGVPLIHLEHLTGFLVVEHPRASRSLNWEDFDLLRTAGQQAASYIAEALSQRALAEARQFDEFNRRFAFIMHDIKNLVSQLSLLVRNAERFGDNPEFQKDMRLTLAESVGKLNDLLMRLQQHNTARSETALVNIVQLVDTVVQAKARTYPFLTLSSTAQAAYVKGDESRLEQVFVHLIQNAIDATPEGMVRVRVSHDGAAVEVAIEDDGCGMSEAFVRNDLFKPFRSTKAGGFGIGAYESQQIIRGSNGRLQVHSELGKGTRFTVSLPQAHPHKAAAQ
jgi:putative PEP-CTERM system histidine kinase